MPPLLCPSPVILDHTFPRNDFELKTAAVALGNLTDCVVRKSMAVLVLTKALREFVINIDWSCKRPDLLVEIHRHLSHLFLQQNSTCIMIELSNVTGYTLHPVPTGIGNGGDLSRWADELGRLLKVHDQAINGHGYFLGIACDKSFSGQTVGTYSSGTHSRAFPLVGPTEIDVLEDGYEWDLPEDAHRIIVGFEDVRRRYSAIGAISFDPPRNGSHYKVLFPDNEVWICDRNWGKEIGDNVLKQLKPRCGLPLEVIKIALKTGTLPKRRLRLNSYVC